MIAHERYRRPDRSRSCGRDDAWSAPSRPSGTFPGQSCCSYSRSALLAAAALFVDGGPSAALGLCRRGSAPLVALLAMLGLALLLVVGARAMLLLEAHADLPGGGVRLPGVAASRTAWSASSRWTRDPLPVARTLLQEGCQHPSLGSSAPLARALSCLRSARVLPVYAACPVGAPVVPGVSPGWMSARSFSSTPSSPYLPVRSALSRCGLSLSAWDNTHAAGRPHRPRRPELA